MYYRKGKYTTQKSFIFQNLLKKLNILIVLMKGTGIKSCLSFQSYRKKIKYKFKKLETFEIKSLLIMFLVLNLLQENLYSFLWDQKNYLSRNFNAKKYVLISLKKRIVENFVQIFLSIVRILESCFWEHPIIWN